MDHGIYSSLKQMKSSCCRWWWFWKYKLVNFVKIPFDIQIIQNQRNKWWSCCGTRKWSGLKLMTQNLNKCFILIFSKAEIWEWNKENLSNGLEDMKKRIVMLKVEAKLEDLCLQNRSHPNVLMQHIRNYKFSNKHLKIEGAPYDRKRETHYACFKMLSVKSFLDS